jgi:hypothetical protein
MKGGSMGTTLITGAGLVSTSFGQHALKRGESLVFLDPQPRQDFLRMKLGAGNFQTVQKDVHDLPALQGGENGKANAYGNVQ